MEGITRAHDPDVASAPALRMTVIAGAILGLVFATGCDQATSLGPEGPESPEGPSADVIRAQVEASDSSSPETEHGSSAIVEGTVELTGLTVELWDGEMWLTLTSEPSSAEIRLSDSEASVTLAPEQEIPAGEYTKARISADEATLDVTVTVDGETKSGQFVLTTDDEPLTVEAPISVEEGSEDRRIFHLDLALIEGASLETVGESSSVTLNLAPPLGSVTLGG